MSRADVPLRLAESHFHNAAVDGALIPVHASILKITIGARHAMRRFGETSVNVSNVVQRID